MNVGNVTNLCLLSSLAEHGSHLSYECHHINWNVTVENCLRGIFYFFSVSSSFPAKNHSQIIIIYIVVNPCQKLQKKDCKLSLTAGQKPKVSESMLCIYRISIWTNLNIRLCLNEPSDLWSCITIRFGISISSFSVHQDNRRRGVHHDNLYLDLIH